MREIIKADQPFVRSEMSRRRGARAVRRPAVQVRDHRAGPGRAGDGGRRARRRRGRRRRHDQRVPQHRRVRRPVQGPARARRPAGSATSSCRRSPAPTGGATRRARCCSASTARRGSPRPRSRTTSTSWTRPRSATTASWPPSSTCSASRSELGGGLAVWHPKGAIVRKLMEDYSRAAPRATAATSSCSRRTSPTASCSRQSGHLDWYADGMYPPMEMDNGTYYMKPMNCPMHCLIFRSRQRSYRELPLRLFELGTVYRYERAGTLHGLMRIRGFTQDDSHIFCTAGAGRRTRSPRCSTSCCRCCGRSASTTSRSTCRRRTRTSTSAPTRSGRRPPTALRAGARHARPRVRGQGGRRRVLRAEDRHRRARRHRPHRGSCRRSSTTSTIPSASTSSTSAPTTPGTGRSCCTAPCSARSSGSSACCSSTTPAPSRRGWRRCRCACCRWRRPTRSTPRRSPTASRAAGGRVDVVDADDQLGKRIRTAKLEKLPYVLVVGDDDVAAGTVGVNPRGGEVERGVDLDEFVEPLRRRGRSGADAPRCSA